MSESAANVLAAAMMAGCLIGAGCLWVSLRCSERGGEAHAHADGTVHEHWRGHKPHAHPTRLDRYDALLDRVFGPGPLSQSASCSTHAPRPGDAPTRR